MVPPHKRRRVSYDTVQNITSPADEQSERERTAAFSSGLEHLSHEHGTSGVHSVPQRIEEIHLQIQRTVILDHLAHLHRRQGTAASSSTLVATVVASVDVNGVTTGLETLGTVAGYPTTSLTTATVSDTPSTSATSSSSQTDSSNISSSDSVSTGSASSSPSSTGPTTSSSTSAPTSNGYIGNTPGTPTTPSSTVPATGSDGTGTPAPSGTTLSSSSVNVTTSAEIIGSGSSLSTSQTTVDLSNVTSTTSASVETSLGAFAYLATLSDHSVETITRSSRPYVTTFPDGQISTIGAIIGIVTTDSRGSTFTSYSTESPSSPTADQGTVTNTAVAGGVGVGQGTATSTTASTNNAANHSSNNNNNNAPPPAGTIAGGVVGGACGLAVVLLIAMLFLRWYRQRSQLGHHALAPSSAMSPEEYQPRSSTQPGMAERAGLMPLIGAAPAMFRHPKRSRKVHADEGPTERGFARVSGRKLPSSFSPGMTGPRSDTPVSGPERNLSSTSFYRDSAGFYGGEGDRLTSPTGGYAGGTLPEEDMTLSPGPQRQPTVHAGGPYIMSPTTSGAGSPRGAMSPGWPPDPAASAPPFSRSDTPSSLDPNRSSRFAEDV